MAYLALYRMFRPTSLNDVVRQEHIVTVLKNQIQSGRIGHAYLFCGPRGTGKTSIAKIFAAAINCDTPVDGSPCGKCARCNALKDPANLDITEIDAASNNGVDEMRELREKVQYPPVAGKYKVFIIDEVHMLSSGAFNALLKTLEEPPRHAVFILATTEAQKIPATILSRCMRFDFKLIPQADLETRLRHVFDSIGKTYEEEAIAAIARAGAGSVRDMLSVADTCVSYSLGKLTYADVTAVLGSADFSAIAALGKAILEADAAAAFEQTEAFLSAGKSVGLLLRDILNFLNACTVAKTCRDGRSILAFPENMYKEVATTAKATDGHRLLRVTEIFAEVEQSLKYSASPRILFEAAVLKAAMPQTDYDIESLLSRISALEQKLKNASIAQNDGGMSATNVVLETVEEAVDEGVSENRSDEETVDSSVNEGDFPTEMEAPPEDLFSSGSFFGGGYTAKNETPPPIAREVAPAPVTEKPKSESRIRVAQNGDPKATFGGFLRALRRLAKNGVLLTLCMDLDATYEGETFVLYTESDTIYRSLSKPEHADLIAQAFDGLGLGNNYAVRLRGKASDDFQEKLNAIQKTFGGVKIDIK